MNRDRAVATVVYGLGDVTTTYVDDEGVWRMSRHQMGFWPEHRADRLVTEAEHGETILACCGYGDHDEYVGNVAEMAAHLAGRK